MSKLNSDVRTWTLDDFFKLCEARKKWGAEKYSIEIDGEKRNQGEFRNTALDLLEELADMYNIKDFWEYNIFDYSIRNLIYELFRYIRDSSNEHPDQNRDQTEIIGEVKRIGVENE